MYTIKVVAGLACGFLAVLISLIVFIKNPEKALYDKAVESIMIQEGLSSFQEVSDSFPELQDIESKMNRITHLNRSIINKTGGPAPNVSREGSQQIQDYSREIRQLRSEVNEELSLLIVNPVIDQP